MRVPTWRERAALNEITYDYEDRAKLGGPKTFQALLDEGWIEPYAGHNPFGDRYQITEAGRAARRMKPTPKPPSRKLTPLPSRIKTLEPSLQALKPKR